MENKCETTDNELNYHGSDPGAVKFGNFINYYAFYNVEERINNLHPKMFSSISASNQLICLDVGCNTGQLTKALYEYLKAHYPNHLLHILGIDIDSTLIERAKELNENPNIKYITCNIMNETDCVALTDYLNSFEEKNTFDITFCFSVTMWIHLNNGDEGLLMFLKFLKSISKNILIEPQPWKCYRNAQRRLIKTGQSFDHYRKLKIKSDIGAVVERVLCTHPHRKTYISQSSSWNRKVLAFSLK